MYSLKKASLNEIIDMRTDCFDALYESQELFLELLIADSEVYIIESSDTVAGYALITSERIIVEFYITKEYIKKCEDIFQYVVSALDADKIYCKSFDSILLKCCMKNAFPYKIIGTLFRDYNPTEYDLMEDFNIRKALEDDIPFLLQQEDGLYESEKELYQMVRGGNIVMYFLGKELTGCGFLIRILEKKEFYDIGMWVKPEHRKKGYASRIISNLKGFCLKNGYTPVCGCASENIASRRTLERNGFVSRHDLIEFRGVSYNMDTDKKTNAL